MVFLCILTIYASGAIGYFIAIKQDFLLYNLLLSVEAVMTPLCWFGVHKALGAAWLTGMLLNTLFYKWDDLFRFLKLIKTE